MFRVVRFLLLLGAIAALPGCTEMVRHDPFVDYPNRANRFDVRFAWTAHPTADALEVAGIARNVRYAYLEDLQLQLSLLDRDKRVVARESYFFIPQQIQRDDYSPFTVTLKGAPPPGGQLEFLYRYRVNEGNDQFHWEGLFTSDLASGAVSWDE